LSHDPENAWLSLADRAVDVAIEDAELLAKGFREYRRYRFKMPDDDAALSARRRDVLCAGRVAAVLPIDLERDEVVLLRQFRLSAHLANGRGELVEIVAGRVEGSEQPIETALRESVEEIGVAPSPLVELFTFLPTPGITEEEITLCLGIVDAAQVPERAGAETEREETRPLRVPIDAALAALAQGTMRNGVLIMALQWLALNRARLGEIAALASEASGQRDHSSEVRAHSASKDARERADDTRHEPGSSARTAREDLNGR
jgi:ADP-ribose pyrophosphatase